MTIFDRAAADYEAVRPSYPVALVDDVVALAHLAPGARLLEVGSGTGQATRLFAGRGFAITAVEAGAAMAAATRAAVPEARVVPARFEALTLPRVFSARLLGHRVALDRSRRRLLPRPRRARRRGRARALLERARARRRRRRLLRRHAGAVRSGGHGAHAPAPERDGRDRTPDIVASGLFTAVERRRYPWHADYDARTYARLLGTYSDHLALPDDVRARLPGGIAALIDGRFGGRIRKHYSTDLYVARAVGSDRRDVDLVI